VSYILPSFVVFSDGSGDRCRPLQCLHACVLTHACAGNEGITAHYNNVALASLPANTSLYDTAHFFAIFDTAQFDGRIAYFTMKYDNLFWRPITAAYQLIRSACPPSLFQAVLMWLWQSCCGKFKGVDVCDNMWHSHNMDVHDTASSHHAAGVCFM
jgi:hypothetical protein